MVGRSNANMSEPVPEIGPSRGQKPRALSAAIIAVVLGFLIYFGFRWMLRSMMLGYMDSAIGRLRVISSAEAQFAEEHPDLGFTCELSQLPKNSEIQRLVSKNRIDNGYALEISACHSPSAGQPNSTYHLTARPLHSGLPAYCSDQSGILKYDENGSAEKCLANGTPF
jgi:hypothetical protein